MIEFTSSFSEYESEESDVGEESEISEHEGSAILERQKTEPGLEIFEIEVEAGPSAKRSRLG